MASLLAGSQVLVTSAEGMGKSFLANQVYEQLLGDNFMVALIEPSSTKQILVEIADLLGVSTKNLEGRSLSSDALKVVIATSPSLPNNCRLHIIPSTSDRLKITSHRNSDRTSLEKVIAVTDNEVIIGLRFLGCLRGIL